MIFVTVKAQLVQVLLADDDDGSDEVMIMMVVIMVIMTMMVMMVMMVRMVMLVKAKVVKVFLSTGTVYNEYLSLHPEADPPPGGNNFPNKP